MPDSSFTTVFDLAQSGYRDWWFPAPGLLFIAGFLFLPKLLKLKAFPRMPLGLDRVFPWILRGFAMVWTTLAFAVTFGDYWGCRQTLLSGRAQYVEGRVTNFEPMPPQGHAEELFTVKGVSFHYSDYVVTASFNNTASHGGPIRAGRYVRIWYWGNNILKLQVAN